MEFDARLAAWLADRQGLLAIRDPDLPTCLTKHGWLRSVGGGNPYLALWLRTGLTRPEVDAAVADGLIGELRAARGCTYIIPRAHETLALAIAGDTSSRTELRTATTYLGVTGDEIERLCGAILGILASGPADPATLRAALGDQIRSLGELGKKKGVTTTLPLAISALQDRAQIRRVPVNGRLDNERYLYRVWQPEPVATTDAERAAAVADLTSLALGWHGVASFEDIRTFTGLTVRELKPAWEATAKREIRPDQFATPTDGDHFDAFTPPAEPVIRFVSSLDNSVLLRRDPRVLARPTDLDRINADPVLRIRAAFGAINANVVLDRGQVVGIWEYDPVTQEIVVWLLRPELTDVVASEQARTAAMIREHLGDLRVSSQDSVRSRQPRLEAIRTQAKRG